MVHDTSLLHVCACCVLPWRGQCHCFMCSVAPVVCCQGAGKLRNNKYQVLGFVGAVPLTGAEAFWSFRFSFAYNVCRLGLRICGSIVSYHARTLHVACAQNVLRIPPGSHDIEPAWHHNVWGTHAGIIHVLLSKQHGIAMASQCLGYTRWLHVLMSKPDKQHGIAMFGVHTLASYTY